MAETLAKNEIALFACRLDGSCQFAIDSEPVPDELSADDWQRYTRMSSDRRRREFIAGRRLIDRAITICPEATRQHWRLHAPAGEPPKLCSDDPTAVLPAISLSHTDRVVLCAMAWLPCLGVDIEHHRTRRVAIDLLANTVMHTTEREAWLATDPREQRRQFFQHWTEKEALAKATGSGLSMSFHQFAIVDGELRQAPAEWPGKHRFWQFITLDIDDDTIVSLAWADAASAMRVRLRMPHEDLWS